MAFQNRITAATGSFNAFTVVWISEDSPYFYLILENWTNLKFPIALTKKNEIGSYAKRAIKFESISFNFNLAILTSIYLLVTYKYVKSLERGHVSRNPHV